jgi:hypothetical protein
VLTKGQLEHQCSSIQTIENIRETREMCRFRCFAHDPDEPPVYALSCLQN